MKIQIEEGQDQPAAQQLQQPTIVTMDFFSVKGFLSDLSGKGISDIMDGSIAEEPSVARIMKFAQ